MNKTSIWAVDFDGTLCENKYPDIGEPNEELIAFLIERKNAGDQIILWTMREGMMQDKAVDWCKERGLTFDTVNDNVPRMKAFYRNNPRKVYADYYIDDHNDPWNHGSVLPYHPAPKPLTSGHYAWGLD